MANSVQNINGSGNSPITYGNLYITGLGNIVYPVVPPPSLPPNNPYNYGGLGICFTSSGQSPTCNNPKGGSVAFYLFDTNYDFCQIAPPFSGYVSRSGLNSNIPPTSIFNFNESINPLIGKEIALAGLDQGVYTLNISGSSGFLTIGESLGNQGDTSFNYNVLNYATGCTFNDLNVGVVQVNLNSPISGQTQLFNYDLQDTPYQGLTTTGFLASGLSVGDYTLVVYTSPACRNFYTLSIPTANQIGTISSSPNGVSCPGTGSNGSVTVEVNPPGITPYNINWTNLPSGIPNGLFSYTHLLPTGDYFYTVTDALGCTTSDDVNVGIDSNFGANIVTNPQSNNICCQAQVGMGLATLSVVPFSGTPPYFVEWNLDPVVTTPSIINVPPGDYSASVMDSVGCQTQVGVTIGSSNVCYQVVWTTYTTLKGIPAPEIYYQQITELYTPDDLPFETPLSYNLPGEYKIIMSVSDSYGNQGIACNDFTIIAFDGNEDNPIQPPQIIYNTYTPKGGDITNPTQIPTPAPEAPIPPSQGGSPWNGGGGSNNKNNPNHPPVTSGGGGGGSGGGGGGTPTKTGYSCCLQVDLFPVNGKCNGYCTNLGSCGNDTPQGWATTTVSGPCNISACNGVFGNPVSGSCCIPSGEDGDGNTIWICIPCPLVCDGPRYCSGKGKGAIFSTKPCGPNGAPCETAGTCCEAQYNNIGIICESNITRGECAARHGTFDGSSSTCDPSPSVGGLTYCLLYPGACCNYNCDDGATCCCENVANILECWADGGQFIPHGSCPLSCNPAGDNPKCCAEPLPDCHTINPMFPTWVQDDCKCECLDSGNCDPDCSLELKWNPDTCSCEPCLPTAYPGPGWQWKCCKWIPCTQESTGNDPCPGGTNFAEGGGPGQIFIPSKCDCECASPVECSSPFTPDDINCCCNCSNTNIAGQTITGCGCSDPSTEPPVCSFGGGFVADCEMCHCNCDCSTFTICNDNECGCLSCPGVSIPADDGFGTTDCNCQCNVAIDGCTLPLIPNSDPTVCNCCCNSSGPCAGVSDPCGGSCPHPECGDCSYSYDSSCNCTCNDGGSGACGGGC